MIFKLNKLLCFSLAVVCLHNNSFSQAPTDQEKYALKQIVPTSPEAALLGRFGDIPIGYYTGTAEINVPLYTIKENGVEIPIALNYHSSGIRVEDQASDVGLGWLMEPGGAVIQIVNGKDDGRDRLLYNSMYPGTQTSYYTYLNSKVIVNGVHGGRNQIGTACLLCVGTDGTGDSLEEIQYLLQGFGQPDIYQYSFPGGYSGKFYIDPKTLTPILIDKKNEINFVNTGTGWLATTLDGNKFYFQAQETATINGADFVGYTWKLSSIVLSNGKSINFSYTSGQYDWQSISESYHTDYPVSESVGVGIDPLIQGGGDFLPTTSGSNTHHDVLTLNQISTDNEIINFNLENRDDMPTVRVKSVDIKSTVTNKLIRSFNFNYDYFTYTTAGGTYLDYQFNHNVSPPPSNYIAKRLKLLSVQEIGYDANLQPVQKPSYQFSYDESNALPLKTSFSRDFWGYYNGANNNRLLPDLTYLYSAGMLRQDFPYTIFQLFNGANRAPDKTKITAGMLMQIKYPTGGYTTFRYEPNSFTNYNSPDGDKIASSYKTISLQDQNSPGDQNSTTFTLARHMLLSFTHHFGKGVPGNTVTFDDLLNATITLSKISGGTTTQLKQWRVQAASRNDFNSTGYVQFSDTYDFVYDASAQYTLVVDLPDYLGNQKDLSKEADVRTYCTYYNIPAVQTQASYGGGVRVASIKNYDSNGALLSNKAIGYINADGTSSGVLMSPLQFITPRTMHFEDLYHIPSGYGAVDETGYTPQKNTGEGDVWWMSSESDIPLSDAAGGNIIGYSRVEEKELVNDIPINGKHAYYYNNQASETGVYTPDNPNLLNGFISKEEIYNNSDVKLAESNYNYVSKHEETLMAFKCLNNVMINYVCEPLNSLKTPAYPPFAYTILCYPINSKWLVLDNKTTTEFRNSIGVTKTENYTYNTIGQISSISTTNSDQKVITHQYKFPYDVASASGSIEDALRSASLYNNLLEDHLLVNNSEVSRTKISYANMSGQLVKNKIEHATYSNPLYTDVSFDGYGPNKTLTQATDKGLIPSAILWNDNNSYIIAEVTNSAPMDIAYTSFETNQAGNWTMVSTSRNNAGFTGSQSYNLSSGALSKANLIAATNYVVSYWTQNTSPYSIAGTVGGIPVKGLTINGWTYYEHHVTGQTTITLSGIGNVDEVRLYPATAQMTTYTYDPLIGMTSSTDAKGETTYYEYDSFQRLMNVRDKDKNIIKSFCYNYAGQATGCFVAQPTFTNSVQNGIFSKGCSTGSTGSSVTYTVPAGQYTSTISQQDADNQAKNDVIANGQNYANANGSCILDVTMAVSNTTVDAYEINFSGSATGSYTRQFTSPTIQVPAGTYNVIIYPTGSTYNNLHTFNLTGQASQTGVPRASFNSVSVSAGSNITISVQ